MSIQSALNFIRATRAKNDDMGVIDDTQPRCLDDLLASAKKIGMACSKAELIEAHRIDWKMRAFHLDQGLRPEPGAPPSIDRTPRQKKPPYQDAVRSIYNGEYVRRYATLWNEDWSQKNADNLRCVEDLLPANGKWLDLCCGGGWHFGKIQTPCEVTGLDLSESQLEVARENNPNARLILGDVLEVQPVPEYDLVSCFWLSYGYLDDMKLIEQFCRRMTEWLKPSGNLVIEVADARAVHTWNDSERGRNSFFRVLPRNASGSQWVFFDEGGVHRLTTPGYEFFDRVLGPAFERHERRFTYNWCGFSRR